MKKYILLLTLSLTLFAQNPKSFAALGDVLYNDVNKFENLKEMASMQEYQASIDAYIALAGETKKMGFAVDAQKAKDPKNTSDDGKKYLKALRELSSQHGAIMLNSRTRFKEALSDEDGVMVNGMIDNGVIDPENYKSEIIRYYEEFGEDQNLSFLEPTYAKSLKKDSNSSVSQKRSSEDMASIKRMRAKEKAKSEALAKSVQDEKNREKKKLLDEHKKELGIK